MNTVWEKTQMPRDDQINHEVPVGLPAKHIRTRITPEGNVEVEAFGYENGACHLATKELEQRIGTVTHSEDKDEGRNTHQTIY
jgi:hypothetical protein